MKFSANFTVDPLMMAGQVASLLHLVLAYVAIGLLVQRRRELGWRMIGPILVSIFIPLLGPVGVIWLLRATMKQSDAAR